MYKKLLKIKLLIVFCLALTACGDKEVIKGEYLKKGIALFQKEQYKASELEIKNAIQEDPKIAQAYYYMALINEKTNKFKAMRENLLRAVKFDPESEVYRLKLGKIQLLFNKLDEVIEDVEILLAKNPNNLEALSLKASVLLRQDKQDEALELIEQILSKDKDNIDAVSLKTYAFLKNKEFSKALSILSPILADNKDDISLQLLKLRVDTQIGDLNIIQTDYERLIELIPDNLKIKYALANVYFEVNKVEQGEALLRSLIANNQAEFESKLALLNYLFRVNRLDALNELDQLIEKDKDNKALIIMLSKWLISKNEIDKAREILKTVIDQNDDVNSRDEAYLIFARIDASGKLFDKALEQLNKIGQGSTVDTEANLLKAQIFFTNWKLDESKELVEKILWQKPNYDKALSLLGAIYLSEGELENAYANYKQALAISPKNLAALNFIVNKEVRDNHVEYAIQLLENSLKYLPTDISILTRLVELYGKQKEWASARDYIERIGENNNGHILSRYLSAKVLYDQQKYKDAIVLYKALLNESPWIRSALVDMVDCYTQLKQYRKIAAYLDSFIKDHPTMVTAYLLKSQTMVRSKQYKKAISFIKESLAKGGLNSQKLYSELGRLYSIVGNTSAELEAYKDGLKVDSNNIGLLLKLASSYERSQLFDNAIENYSKILEIDPGHQLARNNLATIYLDHYDDPNLIKKAVELTQIFKQSLNPYYLDSYGWAQLKNSKIENAVTIFEKVVTVAPDIPVFRYHLAVSYYELGDKPTAALELKRVYQMVKGKQFSERKKLEALLAEIKK